MSQTMLRKRIEPVVLFVLLAIVGMRPLIGESFRTERVSIAVSLENLDDPWVATTIVIDLILLAAGAFVVASRALGRRYRVTGLEWGALLLVAAAIVSSICADEKRPAIVASTDLIASIVLAVALVQLLDARWKLLLAIGVVVASGAATTAESIDQRLTGFEQTERNYMENREAIWSAQGVALDSPQVRLFEQRMRSREASGYFAHSNVAGGYLLVPLFASIGVILAGARRSVRQGGAGILLLIAAVCVTVCLGIAVVLSTSIAAIGAGIGAGVLLIAVLWQRSRIARHRRLVFAGCWSVAIVLALAVVLYGVRRGGLPHPSLDFRWGYWTASARMFGDCGMIGVGAENFGDRYLQYKAIESPEEVKNPHDFGVQIATEYGVLGLAALALLLGFGSWRATLPVCAPADEEHGDDRRVIPYVLAGGVVVACLVFGPRTRLLSSDDPNFVLWMTAYPAMAWVIGFAVTTAVAVGTARDQQSLAALGTAVSCGLLGFLVQDAVNFGLFVPGARTTLLAGLAISIALRSQPVASSEQPARRRIVPVVSAGLCLIMLLLAAVNAPAAIRSERALRVARRSQSPEQWYTRATEADPLDATAPTEFARLLAAMAGRSSDAAERLRLLARAVEVGDEAIRRAPQRYGLWRFQAACHLARAAAGGGDVDLDAAIADARRAVALYPTRPESHVELADCLAATATCEALEEAVVCYSEALALDDARPSWEEFHRLTPEQRDRIRERIQQVESERQKLCD